MNPTRQFGGNWHLTITGDVTLGGFDPDRRVIVATSDQNGRKITLPSTTTAQIPAGKDVLAAYNAGDTYSFVVHDASDTIVATLQPGEWVDLHLLSASGTGTWAAIKASAVVEGPTETDTARERIDFNIDTSTTSGLNLRSLANAGGYDGSLPGLVSVVVPPGISIESYTPGVAAIAAGVWPAGTVITIINSGTISGCGGTGGAGGAIGNDGSAGQRGSTAIDVNTLSVIIFNFGTINGGGGGGGGASGDASTAGGGGGGGALFGLGGAAGGAGAAAGSPGNASTGGAGGTPGPGGSGGLAGQSGQAGASRDGNNGGAAGPIGYYVAAGNATTSNFGTINGTAAP